MLFNHEQYKKQYKNWVNPPAPTQLHCGCGEEFNGVGGGSMNTCPACGKLCPTSFNHFMEPASGAPWSKEAVKLGLHYCYVGERI